jgi:hypothetical protein
MKTLFDLTTRHLVFHSQDFPFPISRHPDNCFIPTFPGNGSGIPGNRIYYVIFLYVPGILGNFHQMLRICLKIHNYVHEISCKEPKCCQPILQKKIECGHIQALLGKNRFPGSREFPGNGIFVPAFPGMAKKLSRGNTTGTLPPPDFIKIVY